MNEKCCHCNEEIKGIKKVKVWNGSLGYCEIEGHVVSENYTCDEEEEEE